MTKTALVTGASGGIGYEFAKILAREKHNLVLIARNAEKLFSIKQQFEDEYQVKVLIIPLDLTIPQVSEQLFQELNKKNINIDILINNAGISGYGKFIDTDWQGEDQLLQLNIRSLTHLTKFFLKGMVERKEGKIVNVASTAAFIPGPLMAVYFATKAYVVSFSEAVATELKGSGVTVTALCPGPTQAGFQEVSYLRSARLLRFLKAPTAKEVAEYGYQAMQRGKLIAVHSVTNKILVQAATRILPRALVRSIINAQQKS